MPLDESKAELTNDYRTRIYAQYASLRAQRSGVLYDQASMRRWADAAHHRLRGWLPVDKGIPILDMGCGHGNFLFLLQEDGYTRVTGIDASPGQVALASRWCDDIHVGDVRDWLQQKPNQYGLITGFDLIEHLRKGEVLPFLDLVYQALIPGGRLIVQTPNAASPRAGAVTHGDLTHECFFTPSSLADACRVAGLECFQARECAPYSRGVRAMLRTWLWQCIRLTLRIWDLAETGGIESDIYTRVFVASAIRPVE